jgi:hypothetical protein
MQTCPWWKKDPQTGGLLDVDVVEHQQGAVAAELEMHALEVLGGQGGDPAAGAGRPGERDHAHVRVGHDGFPDVDTARDHAEHTGGESGLFEDPGQGHPTADGGPRIRLEDDGVPEREGRRHSPDGQDQREVERRDHSHHPDRHPPGQAQPWLVRTQQLPVGVGGQRRGFVALLGGHRRLEVPLRLDRPGFPNDPVRHLVRVLRP